MASSTSTPCHATLLSCGTGMFIADDLERQHLANILWFCTTYIDVPCESPLNGVGWWKGGWGQGGGRGVGDRNIPAGNKLNSNCSGQMESESFRGGAHKNRK